jgi:hypothetical protein
MAGALVAGGALAAPPAPAQSPQMFLSPSGEPFRPTPEKPSGFDAWFDQADTDHDGSLDKGEFRADARRFFKTLDTDGDGVIDGFEIQAYEHQIVPELIAAYEAPTSVFAAAERDRRERKGGRRGGIQRLLNEAEPVSGADLNLDGKVTLDEWLRATDERFDLLDTAKTGRLTREALKARFTPPKRGRAP